MALQPSVNRQRARGLDNYVISTSSPSWRTDVPTPNLIWFNRQQLRLGIHRMFALAPPFAGLIYRFEHPIHRAHRAVITAFIEQSRVNRGRSDIYKALAVENIQDVLPFGLTQCESTGRTWFGRHRVTLRCALTINRSAIDSQCHARRGDARSGVQLVEGGHQVSSPFSWAVGSPSKVQSFFWTSMMVCARPSSPCRRVISRVNFSTCRFSASVESGFGPRRCGSSASRCASRRSLPHLTSSEAYRPSR